MSDPELQTDINVALGHFLAHNPPKRRLLIASYEELAFWLTKVRRPAFDAYHALCAQVKLQNSNPTLN